MTDCNHNEIEYDGTLNIDADGNPYHIGVCRSCGQKVRETYTGTEITEVEER